MTPDEIAADRAVIDAATGGDWQVLVGASWAGEVVVATSDGHPIAVVSTAPADPGAIADATAIAAARTGWPRALDALEVMADAVLDEMTRAEMPATTTVALVGTLCLGLTLARKCGSWPSRAMAKPLDSSFFSTST